MAVPNIFEAGELASAVEVNENFQHVIDRIGGDTTASSFRPPGRQVLGPRRNYVLSGQPDTAVGATSYFEVAYNVDNQNQGGGVWKPFRFYDGEPATALRIGKDGLAVWTTSRTNGDLNAQLTRVFHLQATSGQDFVYVKPSFTRVDEEPNTIQDYRLTFVRFDDPQTVYDSTPINASTTVRDAYGYGVPTSAKAIQVLAEVQTGSTGGKLYVMQERSPRHRKFGIIVAAGPNGYGAACDFVPLGEGGNAGKFVEQRTVSFTSASLFITGYWI